MSLPPWRAGNQQPKTAYTAITTNQTLSHTGQETADSRDVSRDSSRPPNTSSTGDKNDQGQWPDSLKEFVSKCFKEVHPDDKEIMEKELKEIITKAFEQKKTWTIDWKSMWVPIMLARRHKEQGLSRRQQLKKRSNGEMRAKTEEAVSGGYSSTRTNMNEGKPGLSVAQTFAKVNKPNNKLNSTGLYSVNDDYLTSDDRREKRLKRFEKELRSSPTPPTLNITLQDSNEPVVGRSTALEKRYLRLTSAPDPELVRPLHILKQTLELLKKKWREEQNYPYICDQFKSLRQDLTVQHIENEFTVSVYEIHARIALEKSDLGEYNQCQSRLKELYDKGINGNEWEFLAYRILYLLHTQNRAEIGHLLPRLKDSSSDNILKDPGISHALNVDKAMTRRNYHQLFRLYGDAPKMGGYVMDSFIYRERLSALSTICCAYKPDISVEFITKELGFINTQDCIEFLTEVEVTEFLKNDQVKLSTKESYVKIEIARQQAYKKVDIKGQI